jgi:hypothetical protein
MVMRDLALQALGRVTSIVNFSTGWKPISIDPGMLQVAIVRIKAVKHECDATARVKRNLGHLAGPETLRAK